MSDDTELTITNPVTLDNVVDLSHIEIPAPKIAQVNIGELFEPIDRRKRAPVAKADPTNQPTGSKKIAIKLSSDPPKPASTTVEDALIEETITSEKPTKHVFNYEITASQFTKEELAIRPDKEVFIQYSKIKNEELIKYFIIKYNVLEYRCLAKGCPSKNGLWRRNPMYLILIRKNCNPQDLRISNLTFMCPNCFCQDKGPSAFQKIKNIITRTCISCGWVMNQNNGHYELCYRCNEKLKHLNDDIRLSDVIKHSIHDKKVIKSLNSNSGGDKTNVVAPTMDSDQPSSEDDTQKAEYLASLMTEDLVDSVGGKSRTSKRSYTVKHFAKPTTNLDGSGFNEKELCTDLDADLLAQLEDL